MKTILAYLSLSRHMFRFLLFLWRARNSPHPEIIRLAQDLRGPLQVLIPIFLLGILSSLLLVWAGYDYWSIYREQNLRYDIEHNTRHAYPELGRVFESYDQCYGERIEFNRPATTWLRCDFETLEYASSLHVAARFAAYVRARDAQLQKHGLMRYPVMGRFGPM